MKVIKGKDGHSAIDDYIFTDIQSKIEDELWNHVGFSGTAWQAPHCSSICLDFVSSIAMQIHGQALNQPELVNFSIQWCAEERTYRRPH